MGEPRVPGVGPSFCPDCFLFFVFDALDLEVWGQSIGRI